MAIDAENNPNHLEQLQRQITELKKRDVSLKAENEYLKKLYQRAPLSYQSLDSEGNFVEVNQAWLDILGYTREEVIGKNFSDFLHPDWQEHFKEQFPKFKALGEVLGTEFDMVKKDGSTIIASFHGKIGRNSDGEFQQTHCIFQDITERRRAEDALRRIEWMLSPQKSSSSINGNMQYYCNLDYGDLTDHNKCGLIAKSIEKPILYGIAGEYMDLLESSSTIYEKNGDHALAIFSSAWCRLLDSASRKLCVEDDIAEALRSGKWLCHESRWTFCAKLAIETKEPVEIECYGGLQLYSVPIFADDEVIGAINFTYGDPPKDPEKLQEIAELYHLDYEQLLEAAYSYDTRPEVVIEIAKKRLLISARFIGTLVERNSVFKALNESEQKWRNILVNTPQIGVSLDTEANIIFANRHLLEITGWQEHEILGKNWIDTFIPEDTREEIKQMFYATMVLKNTLEFSTYENVIQTKDGELRNVAWSNLLNKNSNDKIINMTSLGIDLTERIRAEEELHKSAEKYRLLVENQTDLVVKVDLEGKFLFVSPSYCKVFGKTEQALLGQKFMPLVHEEDQDSTQDAMQALYSPPHTAHVEQRALTQEGWKWFAWADTGVLDNEGKIIEIIGVGRDITNRKQAEEERKKLQNQLIQAHKLEAIGRLAGGVAHDFNNMLGVILGNAELALEQIDPSEDIFDDLQEICTAAERSVDLTRQLLGFASRQTISPVIIDLDKTMEGMLSMLRRLIGEDILLDWQPGEVEWQIKMDPGQIDQILANLLVNARDAIVGVGKISITTQDVSLNIADSNKTLGLKPGDFVLLTVSDDGAGMSKETLAQIFEPFFTTKQLGEGTGLGLATVYGIIKQNNGSINVTSELNKGSVFSIYLPRYSGSQTNKNATPLSAPKEVGEKTVLLVEDEKAILKMTRRMLEKLGCVVLTANTPGEAISIAEAYSGDINLILTDVVMPEMNGRDLAKRIMSLFPDMKCLFMSGYTADVIAHRGILDIGMNFLQKPFSQKELSVKMHDIFKNR